MIKLLQSILSASRKRRGAAVGVALWMLRLVYGAEDNELRRSNDKLNELSSVSERASPRDYDEAESKWSLSEHALSFLHCAIEDLEFAYGRRL